MIPPINHIVDCRYIGQREQMKTYIFRENTTRIGNGYRVGDQVMIVRKLDFKYKTTFK